MSNNPSFTPKPLSETTTYESGLVQTRVHRLLERQTNAILKKHNLTMMQWFVIGAIYDAADGGVRITDLAKKLDTTLAFLTTMINVLEARGIVIRVGHSDDNRAKLVSVTSDYKKQVSMIERSVRDDLRKVIYSNISPEELQAYIKVLYKLSRLSQ